MKDDKEKENLNIKVKDKIDQKVFILGDQKVGKSSLIGKVFNSIVEKTDNPFPFEYLKVKDDSNNNFLINYEIYEIYGTEEVVQYLKEIQRDNPIAIIVYSIDNKNSFKNIPNWIDRINGCENIIIIGNKKELGDDKRVVSEQKLEDFFDDYNYSHFETSAKYGSNVEELKKCLKEIAIIKYEDLLRRRGIRRTSSMIEEKKAGGEVEINEKNLDEKKDCCCSRCFK